jgi:hypothetical protein
VVEHGGSQIRFSSTHDMTGRWIVAHTVRLQRDWTWSGLLEPGIVIEPASSGPELPMRPFGALSLPFAVSSVATQARTQHRSHTIFTLFETLEATDVESINEGGHEAGCQQHTWRARASVLGQSGFQLTQQADIVSEPQTLSLPYARRPRHVPRVVAMGVLPQSRGNHPAAHASPPTLWIEFERALSVHLAHPTTGLKYFARWRCGESDLPEAAPSAREPTAAAQWTSITQASFDDREHLDPTQDMIELMPVLNPVHSDHKNADGAGVSVEVSRWLLKLPVGAPSLAAAVRQGEFLEVCTGVGSAHWTTPNARFSHMVRVPVHDFF